MSDAVAAPTPLQFERVDPTEGFPEAACTLCQGPIRSAYFQINGAVACATCRHRAEATTGGSGLARFIRAGVLGTLAGALGAAIYYGVGALTGYEFGLIAIVVGLMVGGAVRMGSGGRGGWLFQAMAMFLTYTSIVSTYVPRLVAAVRENAPQQAASTGEAGAVAVHAADASSARANVAASPQPAAPTAASALVAMAMLVGIVFALPFLAGFQNIMGVVIIGIGLYEAWKLNRRVPLEITGPYRLAQRQAAAPAPSV